MKATDKKGSKLISKVLIGGGYGWPPECYGVFYQPERPVVEHKKQATADTQNTHKNDN